MKMKDSNDLMSHITTEYALAVEIYKKADCLGRMSPAAGTPCLSGALAEFDEFESLLFQGRRSKDR